jgi:hypothetical protein
VHTGVSDTWENTVQGWQMTQVRVQSELRLDIQSKDPGKMVLITTIRM